MPRLALLLASLVCILASSFAIASDSHVDHCTDARAALRAGHFARAAELAVAAAVGVDSTRAASSSSSMDCTALRGIALMRAQRIDEGAKVLDALVVSMRRQQATAGARSERPCRVVADYLGAAYELVARRLSAAAASAATPALAARATQQFHAALEMAVAAFQTADAFDAIGRQSASDSEQDDHSCHRLTEFAQPPSFMYRSYGTCLQWLGRDTEARRVFVRGASDARTGWASAWQRPLHAVPLVARALTAGPIYVRDAHPALASLLATLEGELGAIRREFLAHMAASSLTTQTPPPAQPLLRPEEAGLDRNGKWSALLLGSNAQWDAAGAACRAGHFFPHTCALLRRLPLAQVANGQAKFSVMRAGVHVRPHAGPSNARLRVHCTLTLFRDVVGGEAVFRVGRVERVWRDDECFAFDEATEHEVSFRRRVSHAAETAADTQSVAIGVDAQSADAPFRGMVASGDAAHVGGEGDDERRAAYRVVLIVDVANPFVAALDDFRRSAVSERGWRDHEAALRAAWAETAQ